MTVSGVPVAFIHVADRERALQFYEGALGLSVRSSDAFGVFLAVEQVLIRLTALPDFKPHRHPVFGWNVKDIRGCINALRARGVVFTIYEGMGQDPDGVWTRQTAQRRWPGSLH